MKKLFFTLIALILGQLTASACTASFSYTISYSNPLTVNVTNTSTYPTTVANGTLELYTVYDINNSWSTFVNGANTTYTFSQPGTYSVCAYVFAVDSVTMQSCYDSVIQTITVAYPSCFTTATYYIGSSGQAFFNTVTPAGTGINYNWNFGDGSTGTGPSPSHSYTANGTYTVILDATDPVNTCSHEDTLYVSISNAAPCSSSITYNTGVAVNDPAMLTATSIGGSSGMSYSWDFGDGSTGSGASVTHSFANNGYYTVVLITSNSLFGCTNTDTAFVWIANLFNCADLHAGYSASTSNNYAYFTNTSTGTGIHFNDTMTSYFCDFGDGSTETYFPLSHAYATAGTYNVTLAATIFDSLNYSVLCTDTFSSTVTVGNPLSMVTGYLFLDSTIAVSTNPQFNILLIAFDSVAQTLTAIDSTTASFSNSSLVNYQISNVPASGPSVRYLVKAFQTNSPSSGTAFIPTYGYSSLYWNGPVDKFTHNGSGYSTGHNIHVQTGTATSGPGFVGGSVFSGANKGTHTTGDPVAGMTILLEDANNNPVAYTTTDASGNYQFSNIATGTYRVYPEAMGYETTPWASIDVTASGASNINFNQHTISLTITPAPSGVATVAATAADVNIFPNPTTGILNLSWNKALNNTQVTVTDILGRKAMETNLNLNSPEGRTQLNLSSLQPGVYFVTVNAGAINYNTRIVIQR